MIKYRIFNQSASLVIDGEAFSLSASHPNYNEILKLAREQNKEAILAILHHEELQRIGLTIKDGTFYYKNLALPNFFYNKFLKIKSKKDLIPLVNAWFSLEHKLSLLDKKRFGLFLKDSFILWDDSAEIYLYESQNKIFDNQAFFQVEDSEVLNEIKKNQLTVIGYIKQEWQNYDGSVINELKRIVTNEQKINLNFLSLGKFFSNLTATECLDVLKKINLKANNITALLRLAPTLFAKLSKSQLKKFAPELINNGEILNNFRELITLSPEYPIPDFNTLDEFREAIIREIRRYDNCDFTLKIDCTYPKLFNLDNQPIGNELKLIIPKTNNDLIEWGQKLNHCIGSYGKRVAKGQTYCFAIYHQKNNELLYTIEYNGGNVLQFMAKKNMPVKGLNPQHYQQVLQFLKEQLIIN